MGRGNLNRKIDARHQGTREVAMQNCCEACGRPFIEMAKVDGITLSLGNLSYNGAIARLSLTQSRVIEALIKTYPIALHRERLFGTIWSPDTDDKIMDVTMCSLRKKLAPIGLGIKTVWGVGWELVKK